MTYSRLQLACITLTFLAPGLLFAQPPGERGGPPSGGRGGPAPERLMELFERADADQDGSVTKGELTDALEAQGKRDRRERGGDSSRGERRSGEDRQAERSPEGRPRRGPPPRPGQVLPEPVAESLQLTEQQTAQLVELQAEVDRRLSAILTEEQATQLRNARPPHGPRGGERGAGGEGRAKRAQRPE